MRRAHSNELTTRAEPILTARLSRDELETWIPVQFDFIDDPDQTPEPSFGGLIELDAGGYVVIYYGMESGQLRVEIPNTEDPSEAVDAFFAEVPLPRDRVLWHRGDVRIPTGDEPANRVAVAAFTLSPTRRNR